ncbi:S-adenosyl-L-methionine-dependent methyltransferase [Lentinula detonsa]|uniref:S-adenosyl-L-methionine-dependent methyltransferase n=1 Tax=Lentinula detonsa TaxID=2804962 RepID=A0AA38UX51_9AGAR|nr:S-adenosyl-L-methionine-dependent methyltransferase [Lentinula detonsa]
MKLSEKGPGKRPRPPSIPKEEKQAKRAKSLAKVAAKRLKKQRGHVPEACSPEDVRWKDIVSLLGQDVVNKAVEDGIEFDSPFPFKSEVELEVKTISSNGEGLAQSCEEDSIPWVVVVPFCLPGERVKCRVFKNDRMHSLADFIQIIRPNTELRDAERVKCKYFSKCGGCQYQMLSYDSQLAFKRDVVVKAYKNYSDLPASSIPEIQPTIGSPSQYGYRTKITPHFQAPPPKIDRTALQAQVEAGEKPDWLQIGFNIQSQNKVMDIEECPIATPVLNHALPEIYQNVVKTIHTYKKGATLLLRESLDTSVDPDPQDTSKDKQVCITNNHASIRERVGGFLFEYVASSFFQNNNAILPALTSYVREAIASLYPDPSDLARPTHLIDTYCGSGLFAITLSPDFSTVAGIEISADSILYAKHNAKLNNITPDKMSFRKGDAAEIFKSVSDFPPEKTVMVIDPPRKGCDDPFIKQLLEFRPKVVAYVSCNVHTQARDVGKILGATQDVLEGKGEKYVLESLRGFDLFPQTAHVESVAILRLV